MNDTSPARLSQLFQLVTEQIDSPQMLLLADQPEPILERLRAKKLSRARQIEGLAVTGVIADLGVLGDQRWPLVCLLEPNISKPSLIKLLARVRDLHADRVIHVNNTKMTDTGWTLADSLALGFSQMDNSAIAEPLSEHGLQIFEFDIRSYKPAPDWLNAKNWANPEQWDKRRW